MADTTEQTTNIFNNVTIAATTNSSTMRFHGKNFCISAQWTNSSSDATVKLQRSIDNINWYDIDGSEVDATAYTGYDWNFSNAGFSNVRVNVTLTTGSLTGFTANLQSKV